MKHLSRIGLVITICLLASLTAMPAFAHTPLCACYANGDGTATCEGGFSDGSSAAGVEMRIENRAGKVLTKGTMDDFSEFTFDVPTGKYKVVFDAGPGHEIEVDGADITE